LEMTNNPEQRKTRILVVEDNPADVHLLRLALERAELDCELIILEDGGEAMAMVQAPQDSQIGAPDLAILDLNLPKNDGLEVLAAMRANPDFARIPVAVLSSSSSPRDRVKMEAFGIACYIIKPLGLEEYMRIGFTVREMLEKVDGASSKG